MNAEIVSVGTELLLGQTIDTDAAHVAQVLSRLGISIYHRQTVGDNTDRLADALRLAFSRADLVITIGGLGPTMDDLTKEVVADVLGVALVPDAEHRAWLEEAGRRRGWRDMPDSFMKQALVPEKGHGIRNPNGTALGAFFDTGDKLAICLPGPPNELVPMMEESVEPELALRTAGQRAVIKSRVLRFVGIGESLVEQKVADLMLGDNPTVAPYAKTGEVHLRLTSRAPDEQMALSAITPVEAEIRSRLGVYIYGVDDQSLESVVVGLLRQKGLTIATGESCSGGLIAKRITDIPDSSNVFGLGIVAYANDAKERLLGVRPDDLSAHGAVSAEVAKAMAKGARLAAGADIGVSVTGIAGPSGGTDAKPVGTVHIGLAWGDKAISQHHLFLGRRTDVAYRSAQAALALVRLLIVAPDERIFTGEDG